MSLSRLIRWMVYGVGALVLAGGAMTMAACTATGKSPSGVRLETMKASPNWDDDRFVNSLPRKEIPFWETLGKMVRGADHTTPEEPPPMVRRKARDFVEPPGTGLRITWLGHSTLLIEIDGYTVLTDPVWSERGSPFTHVGPRRFQETPLPVDELPEIDIVLISHDHYDHLDHRTIQSLGSRVPLYAVPLGVGACHPIGSSSATGGERWNSTILS